MKQMHLWSTLIVLFGMSQIQASSENTWPYKFDVSVENFKTNVLTDDNVATLNKTDHRSVYAYLYVQYHKKLSELLGIIMPARIETPEGQKKFLNDANVNCRVEKGELIYAYKSVFGGEGKVSATHAAFEKSKALEIDNIIKWLAQTEEGSHNLDIYFNNLAVYILHTTHPNDYAKFVSKDMQEIANPTKEPEFLPSFKFVKSDFDLLTKIKTEDPMNTFVQWKNSLFFLCKFGHEKDSLGELAVHINTYVNVFKENYESTSRVETKKNQSITQENQKRLTKNLNNLTGALHTLSQEKPAPKK